MSEIATDPKTAGEETAGSPPEESGADPQVSVSSPPEESGAGPQVSAAAATNGAGPSSPEPPAEPMPAEEPSTHEAQAAQPPGPEAPAPEPPAAEAAAPGPPADSTPQASEPPAAAASGPPTSDAPVAPASAAAPSASPAPPGPSDTADAPPAAGSAPVGSAAIRLQQATVRILAAFEAKQPIEGKVIGWNKGGFHVSIDGVAAFCPRSLMELGNPRKPAAYLDKAFLFLITNVDDESRRIVVSRKEILEEERRERREEVRRKLKVGAVLRGRVESLVDFGAFVDLDGGIKGLVHLSEISRKRVEHPREALRTGQDVEVKIIKIEKGGDRISLSMRALEPDPWDTIDQIYQAGATFSGKVMRHSEFGLFVEVAEGIEGLVHTSQLPLGVDMSHASIAIGETITGWVREIDTSRHRLSLTLRELPTGDPWRAIQERYQEGQAVPGKVEHASKFGFFVEIEPGITGLLPFSEVSTPPGRRKENMYHPGQTITVQILQVDAKRKRISLGTEGSKVEGSTADYRAYVKKQQRDSGLNALAAAFEKLKQP